MRWTILEGLPEAERERLLQVSRRRRFAAGEVVFHRGDPADTLHLIARGRFAVRIVTPLGDTATLALLGPGQTFGELALLGEEQPRSATVAALEPGETRSIHTLDFQRIRREYPAVDGLLLTLLRLQIERLSTQLVESMYIAADRRVLRRLVDAVRLYGENEAGKGTDVPLTQEELAQLAGTSRATVNKVLREMEDRGALELRRGRAIVLDMAALVRRGGPG